MVMAWVAIVVVCCKMPSKRTKTLSRQHSEVPVAEVINEPKVEPMAAQPHALVTHALQHATLVVPGEMSIAAHVRQLLDFATLVARLQAAQIAVVATLIAARAVVLPDTAESNNAEHWCRRWQCKVKDAVKRHIIAMIATMPKQAWDAVCEEPNFKCASRIPCKSRSVLLAVHQMHRSACLAALFHGFRIVPMRISER